MSAALNGARYAREVLSDHFSVYSNLSANPQGLKPLRKQFPPGEPIAAVTDSSTVLECQPLHLEDGHLVDTEGRRRVLRGINMDSSMKLPVNPFMPSYEGDSSCANNVFFDGDTVSFVGRPFPLEQAADHLERIKSMGYNTIRYLVCWEAIEHEGPGKHDQAFIDYTIEVLRIIYRIGGLYVFIDPHQDVWSRYCGGSGAPLWTLYAAGLEPKRFSACEAAILQNDEKFIQNPESYPKMLWTSNYKRLALLTMFTLFFSGATYFPDLKLDGKNIQHYLQAHYLGSFEALWLAIVARLPEMFANGSMLGMELLNEPNSGLTGSPHLSYIPSEQHLRIGSTPTVFECFRLGMGFPVEVDNFKISVTGPQKDGRVIVDPRGQRAWLEVDELVKIDAKYGWKRSGWGSGECIFAGLGIWEWKNTDLERLANCSQSSRLEFSATDCKMLKPNYFNQVSALVSFDVPDEKLPERIDKHFFVNYFFVESYIKFKAMVRKHAPDAFVFIQPPVLEEPPLLINDARKIIDDKTIYCPHFYDGMSLMFKSWNSRYNVDTLGIMRGRYLNPVLGIVLGERAIRNCLKRQFIEIREEAKTFLGEIPVLMSETGMPFDMDGKMAYDDGRYLSQTAALDALAFALESAGLHHTYWCYSSINCHKWGDRWNNEDFSFWSPDDRDLAFDSDEFPDEKSPGSLSRYSSGSSSRRNSATPSLKSIRAMKESASAVDVLKTKVSYHKNRLLPSLFKKSFMSCPLQEANDDLSVYDDSSLISTSQDNLRYKHFKQCYPSPDGIRAVSAVMRPALITTLGNVVVSEFDMRQAKFVLTIAIGKQVSDSLIMKTPTTIFIPRWHYPYLNYKDIYLSSGHVRYNPEKEYLEWYHYDKEELSGLLTPNTTLEDLEHTLMLKNHSGKIEDLQPREVSNLNDCPLM